ncbi:hypothetical protein K469DRAFT_749431 [Zopfia rhizophila CBS 207.26]|uniref:Uncharacterized protein n=1 Tax=Zopfia rhizophila CBS 207.26 TaxID=1314779 RepID=A0A6A6E8C6_9PEZI|nr:hypothetical protein K469DRAFT_749431 [Zopfia rhizophila CBS 207.26]
MSVSGLDGGDEEFQNFANVCCSVETLRMFQPDVDHLSLEMFKTVIIIFQRQISGSLRELEAMDHECKEFECSARLYDHTEVEEASSILGASKFTTLKVGFDSLAELGSLRMVGNIEPDLSLPATLRSLYICYEGPDSDFVDGLIRNLDAPASRMRRDLLELESITIALFAPSFAKLQKELKVWNICCGILHQ